MKHIFLYYRSSVMKYIKPMILSVILLTVFLCVKTVSAANDVEIIIRADETVSPDKAVDIYIDHNYKDGIGAGQAAITYDSDSLTLKSAALEDKTQDDFFRFTNENGTVRYVFSCPEDSSASRTVKLCFAPLSEGTERYYFTAELAELCDTNGTKLSLELLPACTVNVTGKKIETSTTTSSVKQNRSDGASQKTSANSTSLKSSKNASSSKASKSEKSSKEASTTENNSEEHNIYYVKSSENSFKADKYFIITLTGFAAVCCIAIVFAYKAGKKHQKNEDDQIEERLMKKTKRVKDTAPDDSKDKNKAEDDKNED